MTVYIKGGGVGVVDNVMGGKRLRNGGLMRNRKGRG